MIELDKKDFIRESDGYINLNQICKAGGKEFSEWKRNKKSKAFLQDLSDEILIRVCSLIKYEINSKTDQANWGHPYVAINVAQWVSTKFCVKVSMWIDEWKNISEINSKKYVLSLENISWISILFLL